MRARCPPDCYSCSPGLYGGGYSHRTRDIQPMDRPVTLDLKPSYYGGGYMTPQERFKYTRPRKPYRGGGYDYIPDERDLPYELRGGGFSDFLRKIGSGINKVTSKVQQGIQFYKDNKDTFDTIIGAGKTMINGGKTLVSNYKSGGYNGGGYGYDDYDDYDDY